jgi:hypothetical protein
MRTKVNQSPKPQETKKSPKRYLLISFIKKGGAIFYDPENDIYLVSPWEDPQYFITLDAYSVRSPIEKYGYHELPEPIELEIPDFKDWPSYIPNYLKS